MMELVDVLILLAFVILMAVMLSLFVWMVRDCWRELRRPPTRADWP